MKWKRSKERRDLERKQEEDKQTRLQIGKQKRDKVRHKEQMQENPNKDHRYAKKVTRE